MNKCGHVYGLDKVGTRMIFCGMGGSREVTAVFRICACWGGGGKIFKFSLVWFGLVWVGREGGQGIHNAEEKERKVSEGVISIFMYVRGREFIECTHWHGGRVERY